MKNVRPLAWMRMAALAFWLACVVFLLVPRHASHAAPFSGVHTPQPKSPPARGI